MTRRILTIDGGDIKGVFPAAMLATLEAEIGRPVASYFDLIADRQGSAPPVIDSADVLTAPEIVLSKLCQALDIAWDPAMLRWEKGPHPQDGVWGSHWYDKVNASTGFGDPPGPLPKLSEAYRKVADACRGDYEALKQFAITP